MGWILFLVLIYLLLDKFVPDTKYNRSNDVFIPFEDSANDMSRMDKPEDNDEGF